MTTIWPEHGIGLFLSGNEVTELILTVNEKEDENIQDAYDLDDSNFIGSPIIILHNLVWEHMTDLNGKPFEEDKNKSDFDCIITAKREALPFAAVYENPDQLINELKITVGEYLPENFDYNKHIAYYDLVFEE